MDCCHGTSLVRSVFRAVLSLKAKATKPVHLPECAYCIHCGARAELGPVEDGPIQRSPEPTRGAKRVIETKVLYAQASAKGGKLPVDLTASLA